MIFNHKILASVAPYSRSTYFNRLKDFKDENEFSNSLGGNLLTVEEARHIAEKLGFVKEFDEYLKTKKKPQ